MTPRSKLLTTMTLRRAKTICTAMTGHLPACGRERTIYEDKCYRLGLQNRAGCFYLTEFCNVNFASWEHEVSAAKASRL